MPKVLKSSKKCLLKDHSKEPFNPRIIDAYMSLFGEVCNRAAQERDIRFLDSDWGKMLVESVWEWARIRNKTRHVGLRK